MLSLLRKYATDNTNNSPNAQQPVVTDENVEPDDQNHDLEGRDPIKWTPDTSDLKPVLLVKQFFVCVGFIGVIIAVCTICEYETEDIHLYKVSNALQGTVLGPLAFEFVKVGASKQIYYPLAAINLLVYALCKIKCLVPFIRKYFCSHPTKGAVYLAMFLSNFTHESILHIGVNIFALNSFTPYSVKALGKLQFVALYCCAGVFSCYVSTIYKVTMKRSTFTLGASGAIMGIIVFGFTHGPNAPVAFIFLPSYRFPAYKALIGIIFFEIAGLLSKWQYFDHAGHLGGSFFGMAWCYWGSSVIWDNRDMFLDYYINVKDAVLSLMF